MDNKIIDKARRFLGIDNYPGNLFTLFDDTERIIKDNLIKFYKSMNLKIVD